MNGTSHAVIGAATGFIVANTFHTSPSATLLFVGLGGVSGLMPDLDIDGKLRGKITLSHKVIQFSAMIIGVIMILYSLFEKTTTERWLGIGIGCLIVLVASFIKQRHMLTITGIAVLAAGFSLGELWLILLGIYIVIASFTSHRSYTHSILGIVFFGVIASNLQASLGIDGVFYSCLLGYISHIIADLKILPFNKRGIKLFLPLTSKEL
ncbi:metal-dependent hydrolase [Neobacillus sp. SuZ13]|uniref:metal-dependent hydrolase n=1 Tax=Neobacillus sp. SuZ13 TaxID=3047875 RepID=UPI0024BF8A78|nr:metal-dependent hydrolase [Neobacillus sp. SuZ13]WHY69555.1 metal-dependent hydrolase [Neobacillus sp. SuZ13]